MTDDYCHLTVRGKSETARTDYSVTWENMSDGSPLILLTVELWEMEFELSLLLKQSRALREQLRKAETNAIAASGDENFGLEEEP